MTSLEGRVIRRRIATAAPEGARSELWILRELARRLAAPGVYSEDPREVFDELARASAGGVADYSGIDYDLLDSGAEVYWPYPVGSTGTPRLFRDGFAHPDSRARIVAVSTRGPVIPGPGQLTLITGRLLEQYQSGNQTRRVAELNDARPEAVAELHPATASDLGIGAGDLVSITNERGEVRVPARLSADIRRDTVFLPFHYADEQSANILTRDATDPISGMPEFKNALVTVRAAAAAEVPA